MKKEKNISLSPNEQKKEKCVCKKSRTKYDYEDYSWYCVKCGRSISIFALGTT